MKKLFIILALVGFAFITNAQQINFPEGNMLIYSDTNTFAGGDVFIRTLYSYVPQDNGDGTYTYWYKQIYYLNENVIENELIDYRTTLNETVSIDGVQRTYPFIQAQTVTINTVNWKKAAWQTYLQKVL